MPTRPWERHEDDGPRTLPAPRFELLDALRGIAAVAVVLYHVSTRAGATMLVTNGYLAVDFFFMLSGFVMAQSYGARLAEGMTFDDFARRRLVRLMPMAVLGAALGAGQLLLRSVAAPDRSDPLVEVAVAGLLNLLVLPKLWHARATGWELFPANGPLWSLMAEIVANLVWAGLVIGWRARLPRAPRGVPGGAWLATAAAGLTISATVHGTLNIGWELPSLDGALWRIAYGFGCGLLVHRWRARLPVLRRRWGIVVAGGLVYFLCLPVVAVAWTLVVALLCMPALLALAVAVEDQRVGPAGAWLGRVSYPLYAVHFPLIALFAGAVKKLAGGAPGGLLPYLIVPPIMLAAWAALVWWEEPARAWLGRWMQPRRWRGVRGATAVAPGPIVRMRAGAH